MLQTFFFPSSQLYPSRTNAKNITLVKSLALILVLSVQVCSDKTGGSENCVTISSAALSSNCTYCQYQNSFTCNQTLSNKTVKKLFQSECTAVCCNSTLFDNTQNYGLCNNQSSYAVTTSSLSLATILIIIFFSIPAGICLLIAICTCITNHRLRTEEGRQSQPISAVNLAAFNMDDLGPLYQDRTHSCSICLEADCNLRTRCGHAYHSQCLNAWIHKKQKCPLCVTKDFNPIILYCMNCFKQIKMVVLMDSMPSGDTEEWRNYNEWKCEQCLKDHLDDVISLDFSLPQIKGKEKKDSKMRGEDNHQIQKSQSHQKVVHDM